MNLNEIRLEFLSSPEEMEVVRQLESHVWESEPTPVHQTLAFTKHGGVVVGAYLREFLIGLNIAFPAFKDGHAYLVSHSIGIHQDYRGEGLGRKLKMKLREKAIELGYDLIQWTFDPLETANGRLYLHHLRAQGVCYKENYYGLLADSLNAGLPTDRMIVNWNIKDLDFDAKCDSSTARSIIKVTQRDGYHYPETLPINIEDHDHWQISVPSHFQKLKEERPELAKTWRILTRECFQNLLKTGFVATDLYPIEEGLHSYLFKKIKA